MKYLLALVHSWWWHLTYGMWKGYRETRTYAPKVEYGWKVRGPLVALTSTDGDYRIVKVFWKRAGPWSADLPHDIQEKP